MKRAWLPALAGAVLVSPGPATAHLDEAGIGTRVAVIQQALRRVAFVDASTGDVLAFAPVEDGPHELALSPDGRLAVASNYGAMRSGTSITFIDVDEGRTIGHTSLGEHPRPHGMVFSPDGARLYVTTEAARAIVEVDVATRSVTRTIETDQGGSHMIALSPKGDRAYVANVHSGSMSVIDLEKGEVVKTVPSRAGCEGVGVSPDGTRVWLANNQSNTVTVIDAATLEERTTVPCDGFPLRVCFTPDGSRALVLAAKSGEVVVYDAARIEEITRIDTRVAHRPIVQAGSLSAGSPVPLSIAMSPDGSRAYVSCKAGDYVLVIDPLRGAVVGDFAVQGSPDGIVLLPAREEAEGHADSGD
ncbi:MAG: beta-propeller fold lactonase family protein [Phycisphaerales bacterium]|nr:beta-propeller fold lactonase family protein [Phycisphaerales bacterium]